MSTRLTRLFAVIGVQPLSEAALGAIISPPVFWRRYFCSLSHWELFRSYPQLALVWTMWRWNVKCSRCREEGFWSCDQVCGCFLVTRHTSHVTRHTPHVTRHTPNVTRHTSHVTRHTLADCSRACARAFSPPPAKANTSSTFATFPKLSLAFVQSLLHNIKTNAACCD